MFKNLHCTSVDPIPLIIFFSELNRLKSTLFQQVKDAVDFPCFCSLEYSLVSDWYMGFVSVSKSPICRVGSDTNLISRSLVMR